MKVFHNISESKGIKNPVLTLGMFDGIHLGHRAIIQELNSIAKKVDGESVLLTFEPHPRVVLGKGADDLQLLTLIDEKIKLFEKYGLQNLIIHPFTKEFSQLSSEDFIKNLLVDEVGIHTILVGFDHHFGRNREGNFDQILELSKKLDFNCEKLEEVKTEGHSISSTATRNALWEGDAERAAGNLGRSYDLSGEVIHGNKLGRTLGFPTANLQVHKHKLIPKDGVYLVKVLLNNEVFKGLLSIGTRPTVTNSNERRVEVYILDFDKDIYGENLTLEFIRKIRDDIKFDSIDDLVIQMNKDKKDAEDYSL